MTNHTKIALAAAFIVAFASAAFAADEWIVDSGRFANDMPSAAIRAPSHARHLIEGRNAASTVFGNGQAGYESLVQASGN
jgi:hypothetical protein